MKYIKLMCWSNNYLFVHKQLFYVPTTYNFLSIFQKSYNYTRKILLQEFKVSFDDEAIVIDI